MNDIVWSYRDNDFNTDRELVGYSVMASDGPIGQIDESSTEATGQWLVVDTGFWIFGKKRLIPAGTVTGIDHEGGTVVVNVSKDEIRSAPDFDKDDWNDEAKARHTDYYSGLDDR